VKILEQELQSLKSNSPPSSSSSSKSKIVKNNEHQKQLNSHLQNIISKEDNEAHLAFQHEAEELQKRLDIMNTQHVTYYNFFCFFS
jgi:hypothetical protein